MSNTMSKAEGTKKSPVEDVMCRLERKARDLHEELCTLTDALAPVLSHAPPETGSTPEVGEEGVSPLHDALLDLERRCSVAVDSVRILRARVTV